MILIKPVFEDAPGISIKRMKRDWQARWIARQDLVKRGYRPKYLRLWRGNEPSDAERKWLSDRCTTQQNEMLAWARGVATPKAPRGNNLGRLMHRYCTDTLSNYYKGQHAMDGGLEYCTRRYYDRLMAQLGETKWTDEEDGVERIASETSIEEIKGRTIHLWHQKWSHNGRKVSMGHALVGMLRTLVNFGAAYFDDLECARVSIILSKLKFDNGQPRTVRITRDQVIAIAASARPTLPMVSLAQVLQFEFGWRQKDVIGEWLPQSERSKLSEILDGNMKWVKGLRWEEIDADLVVHHITSKRKKLSEPDLKLAPLTLAELGRMWPGCYEIDGDKIIPHRDVLPAKGPVILDLGPHIPYYADDFREEWRKHAVACNVPLNVQNRDTRAGAVSEAIALGANPEHVRDMATHSDVSQTRDYSRASRENTATVMEQRAKLSKNVA
jgi:hypothetical protein